MASVDGVTVRVHQSTTVQRDRSFRGGQCNGPVRFPRPRQQPPGAPTLRHTPRMQRCKPFSPRLDPPTNLPWRLLLSFNATTYMV